MTSQLSTLFRIPERSEATPGLWNAVYDQVDANFAALDFTASGSTLSIGADLWLAGSELIGEAPSYSTRAALKLAVRSDTSDYIYFEDSSAAKSDYLLGSRVGGTADGLNLYDVSGDTMLVSFSKQSIRFYQQVVGPVFDVGGALADTYNAATFGTGLDSTESRIQSAINQASIDGVSRVYLPASMYPYSASSVSFIYTVQMVREGGNWAVYDVQAYGARNDGTGNAGPAIQSAISAAQGATGGVGGALGAIVSLPRGTYNMVTGVQVTTRNIHLVGDGPRTSILQFRPTSAGTCITLSGGTNSVWNCSIRGLSFYSPDTGFKKTMIQLRDVRFCELHGIESQDDSWSGQSDIGLWTEGLEYIRVVHSAFRAPRPIVIAPNPNRVDISLDLSEFLHLQTVVDTGVQKPNIEILDGTVLTFNHFRDIDCAKGNGGIRWVTSTTTAAASFNNTFDGIKCEQGTAGNEFSFDIRRTAGSQIQNLFFRNCAADVGHNGYQLQGVFNTVMDSCRHQKLTGSALSVDNTNQGMVIRNFYHGTGTVISGLTTVTGWVLEGTLNQTTPTPNDFSAGARVGAGSALLPTMAFTSENSLGWYRSAASIMNLSYGALVLGNDPGTAGEVLRTDGGSRFSGGVITTGPVAALKIDNRTTPGTSIWQIYNQSGGELRFFVDGGDEMFLSTTHLTPASASGLTLGSTLRPFSGIVLSDGVAIAPRMTFSSESSLGWYRSGASTMALSNGTLLINGPMWSTSGISVGNATAGGSLIRAISSMSSLVGAFVVQPSASSFTVVTWAAAQPGDQILTTVMQSGAVSSLSSGLVLHSHCTQAGQIEFRLSNVSTLAQNQSSRTYLFTRISPF